VNQGENRTNGHHGPRRRRVTIVVPVKNEEAAIAATLRSIPTRTLECAGYDVETIILDGQSRDSTRDLAYRHGGTTVIFEEGRGKGQALNYARRLLEGDFVIMMDGDGTYAADAIPRILGPLDFSEADIVMGSRRIRPGAMSISHRIGNRILSLSALLLYHRPCPDLCTGMWGFRTDALKALPLRSRGFDLEAEMFAVASRLKLTIQHVPIDYLPRRGASKITKRDGLAILWRLVQRRMSPVRPTGPLMPRAPRAQTSLATARQPGR
jgi:dolichol-phosphate hexosyltransferase